MDRWEVSERFDSFFGSQKKLSLHLSNEETVPRLTLVNESVGYILKPSDSDYPQITECEWTVMEAAERCGIHTAPHALMKTGEEGQLSYITKRVDCEFTRHGIHRYAMEDFCQLSGKLTADKYLGSYERAAKIITKLSSQNGLDLTEYYLRILFCFLTGNSDMHLKNFSLRETEPGNRIFILSEAYDLLCVDLIMPEDTEETALTLHGKKKNITRNDFLKFAGSINIQRPAAEKNDAVSTEERRHHPGHCDPFAAA